jgi:hypothetical protein
MRTFYKLGDIPKMDERKRLGVPGVWTYYNTNIRAIRTESFRPPRAGEWYLSGATPHAYRAPNDLSTAYRIMRLVHIERSESVRIVSSL